MKEFNEEARAEATLSVSDDVGGTVAWGFGPYIPCDAMNILYMNDVIDVGMEWVPNT